MNAEKPLYIHDCDDTCIFLGTYTPNRPEIPGVPRQYDLYVHSDKEYSTYIARWSSDGPDYHSGKEFVGHIPMITEAHERAKAIKKNIIP